MKHAPIMERLERLSVPEPNTGCWLWLGFATSEKYPRLGGELNGTPMPLPAQRVAWEHLHGQTVPPGLFVRCRQGMRLCVNPTHQKLRPPTKVTILGPRRRRMLGSKLTLEDVQAIRAARATGELLLAIAHRFGVTEGTISRIVRDLSWRGT